MHRTYSSTSIRMPLKPKSWAHHRLNEFQMARPVVFMTSSLQLFLVTWCCCLVATKDDVPLLYVFGTGNDVVTNPNRRTAATLKLHFFSCTLPKSYEHTGCCWISFYAPEGRRMLDDLGEHQRSLCLEEVAKEHERCLLVYFREIGADLKLKVSHENLLL